IIWLASPHLQPGVISERIDITEDAVELLAAGFEQHSFELGMCSTTTIMMAI
ncbi:hypothetical protein XENOCAPTIV_009153, partial [Xenoophorus captivus]